jgi:hypothetical protein
MPRARSATCAQALTRGGIDITELGNHHGMSATVLLDPAAELYLRTGEPRYLRWRELIVQQPTRAPLNLLTPAAERRGCGGNRHRQGLPAVLEYGRLAKLHRATGKPQYLQAVRMCGTAYASSTCPGRRPVGRRGAPLARGVQSPRRVFARTAISRPAPRWRGCS